MQEQTKETGVGILEPRVLVTGDSKVERVKSPCRPFVFVAE